ncbi:PEP-CTERM sorting domain-containing protein [Methylomagnum sp.]
MSIAILKEKLTKSLSRGMLAGVVLMSFATMGQAATLGLVSKPTDITDSFAAAKYSVGGSNNFQLASAFGAGISPFTYVLPGNPTTYNVANGTYTLGATISNAGILSGGTFSLVGDFDTVAGTTTLMGNVTGFGYAANVFEFLVNVTSGSNALNIPVGATLGVILSDLPKTFNVAADFALAGNAFDQTTDTGADCLSNSNCARSDTFVVPEPASLSLLGIGALAARRFGRRT